MNNQEIFTPEERDENIERKRELIELVASGEAVLIVGAGSSVRVGYVTWAGLLEELENLANECGGFEPDEGKRENDPLAYAKDIKSHICDETGDLNRYYALLYKLFKPRTPSFAGFHKMLVSLPFRGILTTNYDTVLEAALNDKDPTRAHDNTLVIGSHPAIRVHDFLMSMNDKRIPQWIVHLHGSIDRSDSIILGIKDYHRAYGFRLTANQVPRDSEWTLHRKLLWAMLATRRVVFIGFSMDDPYFNKMLETVSADLWIWDKSIHFAIMDISSESAEDSKDKAKRLRKEYGVDTVFYDNSDKSYQGLDGIIAEIDKKCHVESPSTTTGQDLSGDSHRPEDEKPKSVASGAEDKRPWLKRVSRRMARRIGDEN